MPFDGFPRNVRATPTPDPLFNVLLEEIEDLAELKVTLRLIWLLGQQRGRIPFVAESELLRDPTLLRGLSGLGGDPEERIRQGLNLAVTRGTALRQRAKGEAGERFYLLNSAETRRRLAGRPGLPEAAPAAYQSDGPGGADLPERPPGGRPGIYDLYENNIGTIGPLMAEQLAEAEERYPPQWIEEAFKLAVFENKRSWRYIAAILRRWGAEGKNPSIDRDDSGPMNYPGVGEKAGAVLWDEASRPQGGPDGESGRHSETDNHARPHRSRQRR